MEISQKQFNILLAVFVGLIMLMGIFMYEYNEDRNEIVEGLIEKGYECEKNPLGIYKKCTSPEDVRKNLALVKNYEVIAHG